MLTLNMRSEKQEEVSNGSQSFCFSNWKDRLPTEKQKMVGCQSGGKYFEFSLGRIRIETCKFNAK